MENSGKKTLELHKKIPKKCKNCDSYNEIENIYTELNDKLIKTQNIANESIKLKSAFLSNLSHEIRTPMNGIVGFAEMLKDPNLSKEDMRSYIDIITTSSEQLLSIINDIIEISKMESGDLKLEPTIFSLNELIESLQKDFEHQANLKNLSLSSDIFWNTGKDNIYCDYNKLYQTLSNLIRNGLKFTKKGYVDFGYKQKGKFIEFYVKDSGIGIYDDKKELIFKRFQQAEYSYTRRYGGTGLGLSIAKSFVNLMGGKIWFESEYGKGSCFYFNIPNKPVIEPEFDNEYIDQYDFNWENFSVLIVEDEEINYQYLKKILELTSINIYHAKDGVEAVDMCKNSNFDIVLMDVKLPRLNGYKATDIIKNISPKIPIIAQTAYAFKEDRVEALESGCDDYISKPIDKNELYKIMSKFLIE